MQKLDLKFHISREERGIFANACVAYSNASAGACGAFEWLLLLQRLDLGCQIIRLPLVAAIEAGDFSIRIQ